ncbi:MAG: hypothetical protein WC421_04110 [Elusimicrobiales bacterium]
MFEILNRVCKYAVLWIAQHFKNKMIIFIIGIPRRIFPKHCRMLVIKSGILQITINGIGFFLGMGYPGYARRRQNSTKKYYSHFVFSGSGRR